MPTTKKTVAKKPSPAAKVARAATPKTKPASKPKPKPKAPRVEAWSPRAVPIHALDGKPSDPRLAAALAARERWHGRSGRPALKSGTQAVAFVRERHLVHPTVESALPNLLDPIVGRPCTDEDRGTGIPAATLRAWSKELHAATDLLDARLCFERSTLVTSELWPSLITVATPRIEKARDGNLLSPDATETLDLLDRKGAFSAERLRQLLGLTPKEFERVQGELESHLIVISRSGVDEDDEPITLLEPLERWAERAMGGRKQELELSRAWTFLFIAALRSAVVLWPEEIDALFPWTREERDAAIREAMGTGAVVTYAEGKSLAFVASPVPR